MTLSSGHERLKIGFESAIKLEIPLDHMVLYCAFGAVWPCLLTMKRPNLVAKRTENPSAFLHFFFEIGGKQMSFQNTQLPNFSSVGGKRGNLLEITRLWMRTTKFGSSYIYQIKCDDEQGKVWLGKKTRIWIRVSDFAFVFSFNFLFWGGRRNRRQDINLSRLLFPRQTERLFFLILSLLAVGDLEHLQRFLWS